jgi:hypothetical protein
LSLSMHAQPGLYAVLIGSGVSRSAGIPTGWDIVVDLIRKLAEVHNESCDQDPEAWFRQKFEGAPTYSGLLEMLGMTQAERCRLLKGYFEPGEGELEEGRRVPTKAHEALAQLVASGYIKVILTTNFDRLVERALEAVGVSPTVIASSDGAEGAMPLVHTGCTLIKLHGDYHDWRIRNTPEELAGYDERINTLLDRVLDEFGLIICGWSGEWDVALRAALERCKNRRFSTYWAAYGQLTEAAQDLIELRGAQVVPIQDADTFFPQLADRVDALSRTRPPHPMAANVAAALAKKYVSEDRFRIQLHDLLMGEVERVVRGTDADRYPVDEPLTGPQVAERVEAFEALSAATIRVIVTGCYWGDERHAGMWAKAIDRLANPGQAHLMRTDLAPLRLYPALLALYAGSIAAIAGERFGTLLVLFSKPTVRDDGRTESITRGLHDEVQDRVFRAVPGLKDHRPAVSGRVREVLRAALGDLIPGDEVYGRLFDLYEAIRSLWSVDDNGEMVPAAFMRTRFATSQADVLARVVGDAESTELGRRLLAAGFFGRDDARYRRVREQVYEQWRDLARRC